MKQEQFLLRHQHEWRQFEDWLRLRGETAHTRRDPAAPADLPGDETIPQRYRRLCQQLALARRRGYSPQLVERLQQLMQRGHNLLYRAPPPRWRRAPEFLLADFPRLVRSQAGAMWAACALLVLPLAVIFVLMQYKPDLIYLLMDPGEVARFEEMYNPAAEVWGRGRDSGGDWYMFGVYIMNNISIGLKTFASGLLVGLGPVLVLASNGIDIGAVAGHLQHIGSGGPFWRFVAGHSPFELTAIVIAGGAGLQLGLRVLAPGRKRRADALVEGCVIGAKLCLGVAFMLLTAAFIEAFWSSTAWVPAWGKYTVSGVLWTLVFAWLWRGGRGGGHAD